MKKLAENLYKGIVLPNEGYDYLFSKDLFLPIYDTTLLVTKRIVVDLNLVEEKVLQLIDIGMFQIDEIANVLGLERNLLNVTIADLYTKGLIMTSSNSCKLLIKGKTALNQLNCIERKQDILRNIYLDAVSGEIIQDINKYQFMDKVFENDNKIKEKISLGNIEFYSKKFKEICEIFNVESDVVNVGGVLSQREEIIRLENIESVYVKFLRIPVCIFVSSNGFDIDITARNSKLSNIVEIYKDEIIDQIVNKKLLRNDFRNRALKSDYSVLKEYNSDSILLERLKNYHFNKNSQTNDALKNNIFLNRKLFYGEEKVLLSYLIENASDIEINIDNLEDWSYNHDFLSMLTEISPNKNLSIIYKDSINSKKSEEKIKNTYKNKIKFEQKNNPYYLCWKFDGNIFLYGIPKTRVVIDANIHVIMVNYFLEILNKEVCG